MLLRVKEETGEEIAGFVEAVRSSLHPPQQLAVDLDWGCYAGKRRHNPWFVLSALALAEAGYKVFMHGAQGHTEGRVYAQDSFAQLGLPLAQSWSDAEISIREHNIVYFPIAHLCPKIHQLIELRPLMGLRSPVHTLSRLINPLSAPAVVQGIFHPAYNGIHQQAARHLDYSSALVIRGEGGEFERNPESAVTLHRVILGTESTMDLEAVLKQRQIKPEHLDLEQMKKLWRGQQTDIYGEAAVTSTIQLALMAMSPDKTAEQAGDDAADIWHNRDRHRL